jgi:hypothetical protein
MGTAAAAAQNDLPVDIIDNWLVHIRHESTSKAHANPHDLHLCISHMLATPLMNLSLIVDSLMQ